MHTKAEKNARAVVVVLHYYGSKLRFTGGQSQMLRVGAFPRVFGLSHNGEDALNSATVVWLSGAHSFCISLG